MPRGRRAPVSEDLAIATIGAGRSALLVAYDLKLAGMIVT